MEKLITLLEGNNQSTTTFIKEITENIIQSYKNKKEPDKFNFYLDQLKIMESQKEHERIAKLIYIVSKSLTLFKKDYQQKRDEICCEGILSYIRKYLEHIDSLDSECLDNLEAIIKLFVVLNEIAGIKGKEGLEDYCFEIIMKASLTYYDAVATNDYLNKELHECVDYSGAINFHELSHYCAGNMIINNKENHRSYEAIINPNINLPLSNLKPSKITFYNLLFYSLSSANLIDFKDNLIDSNSLYNYLYNNSRYRKTLIDLNIDENSILPKGNYINFLESNQIIVKNKSNYHILIASEKAKDIIQHICQGYGENSINPLCDLTTEIVTLYSNIVLANNLLATNNGIIRSIYDSITLTNKDPNGKYSLDNQGSSNRKKYLITDGIVNVDNDIDNIEVSKASFTIIKNHISHEAPSEYIYYEDMNTADENLTYNADEISVFTYNLFSEDITASLLASREIPSVDAYDKLLDKIAILTEMAQKLKHKNSKNILVEEYISAIKTIMNKAMSVTDANKNQYIILTDKSVNLIKMWKALINNIQVQSLLNQLSSSQEQSYQLKKGLK